MADYRVCVTQQEDKQVIKRLNSNVSPAVYDGNDYGIFGEIGRLNFPSGVTTDGTDVYLADYNNKRIVWLNSTLELITDHVMESTIIRPRLIYYDSITGDFYVLNVIPNSWGLTLIRMHKSESSFSEDKTSDLLGTMENCWTPMGMTKDDTDLIVCGLGKDLFVATETVDNFTPFVNQTVYGVSPVRYTGIIKHSNGYFYLNDGTKIIKVERVTGNFISIGNSNYISKTICSLKEARDGSILLFNADAKSILRYDENLNFIEEVFKDSGYSTHDEGIWIERESDRVWMDVAASSDGKIQTAVVYEGRIYTSIDYGATWTARESNRGWYGVAMSSDGKIQTVTDDGPYGGYGGQIYTSADFGVTWTARDSDRLWTRVAMSVDGRIQTALVYGDQVYTSTDYGATWIARSIYKPEELPPWNGKLLFDVAMSSDGRIQTVACGAHSIFMDLPDYLYVSYDYGVTWTAKGSSQCWCGIAMSSNGRIQTATVSTGYTPNDGKIYTSYDYGNTWTLIVDNIHVFTAAMMSSDGQLQVMGAADRIYVSTDCGVTWTTKTDPRWTGMYRGAMSDDGIRQTILNQNGKIYTLFVSHSIESDCSNVFDFIELNLS